MSSVDADPGPEESFDDDSFADESGVEDDSDVEDVPGELVDPVASDPESEDDESDDDESDDDESEEGSATATQGNATTAVPIPSATASAPTLPMYFAFPISVSVNAVVLRRMMAPYSNWTKPDLLPITINAVVEQRARLFDRGNATAAKPARFNRNITNPIQAVLDRSLSELDHVAAPRLSATDGSSTGTHNVV